jgi:hypothetical protein
MSPIRAVAWLVIGIVVLWLIPLPLTPTTARLLFVVGVLALIGGYALVAAVQSIASVGPLWPFDGLTIGESMNELLRHIRVPLAALIFFVFWTLLLALVWSLHPQACPVDQRGPCPGAFAGLGAEPRLRDFLYLAINNAFINFPADVVPRSAGVKLALTLEVVTAALLVGAYIQGWLQRSGAADA